MAGKERWYTLYTRPSFEAIAARELRKRGFNVRRSSAGQLLCRFALDDCHPVLSAPGVLAIAEAPEVTERRTEN